MKIALFTETFLPRIDGVTHTLCHLLKHLELRGHQALLFAPSGGPSAFASARVIGLEGWRFPIYPEFRFISPLAGVDDELNAFQPDLVHVLNPVSLGLGAILRAHRANLPVVASYHTDVPGFAKQWRLGFLSGALSAYFRFVHNLADLNLCPSKFTLNKLAAEGYHHLRLWSRGIDIHRFSPTKRSDVWRNCLSDGHNDAPLLLFVGRLGHEKRVDWLRPVLDALPHVHLAIVGDGPARQYLENVFRGTATQFMGALTGEDLAAVYASADIFVFPGANETLGNVVLEAMASQLPVIAPRAGGLLDHVVDGETALLFESQSKACLVETVRLLLSEPILARRMGVAGREHVRTRSWEDILDTLISDYTELIIRHRYEHPQRSVHIASSSSPTHIWPNRT